MNLKPRHKVDPSFNMSSMTDIIFLLLIFFIMTSSSVTPTGKKVDLPSGKNDPVSVQKIQIVVTKDLEYQVDGKKVSFESLPSALKAAYKYPSDNKLENVVVVRGDQAVDYGEVMKVVALAGELENVTVTLATKPL